MVTNTHERTVSLSAADARQILASLASDDDRLWPIDYWWPMRLDRGLTVGSKGGHADVTYIVESVEPDRVVMRFIPPFGMDGTHRFELDGAGTRTIFRHVIQANLRGAMRLAWPVIVRPIHDAVVEDAFDRVAVAAGDPPTARWSPTVRSLRGLERWATPRTPRSTQRAVGLAAGIALAATSALHGVWATRNPWPLPTRDRFAEVVMGQGGFPPPAASATVAVGLAAAAASVARPRSGPRRLFGLATGVALAARGVMGLATYPVAKRSFPDYARMDLRIYSPLCLALSAATIHALRPEPDAVKEVAQPSALVDNRA